MEDSQKRPRLVKVLLIIVIVGILGFAGWYFWQSKNNSNGVYVASCSTTTQITGNKSSGPPNGWKWYEIKDIGVKYAYPKSWGSPTTLTNSGSPKYAASFTLSPSGANTIVTLDPSCSEFQPTLSDINNGKFDTLSGPTITKAIEHDKSSYSSLSHWSGDAGNHYKLVTYDVVSVGNIKSVTVDYSVITGTEVCPDDQLAPSGKTKCINQSISDEVDKVISSLQKN